MGKEDFFYCQKDGTSVKIEFYEHYLEGYLFKVLMQFGACIIADLFCGTGRNGTKEGSPLVLIRKAKEILANEKLLAVTKDPKIYVIFNDSNKENIEKLDQELKAIEQINNLKVFQPENKSFSDILKDVLKINAKIPKFFFLDPFTYSNIQMDELKKIMDLSFPEVLLFLPGSFAYRFSNCKTTAPKTLDFFKNFTDKGDCEYEDIYAFNNSIVRKIKKDLNLKFVRYVLIDVGKSKHSLFLLTKHIKGMMLFNNLFDKETLDGQRLKVKTIKYLKTQKMLFPKNEIFSANLKPKIDKFEKKFTEELKTKGKMDNKEIIEFAVIEGVKPKVANDVLKNLKTNGKIKVDYFVEGKNKGFYVSEDNYDKRLCLVTVLW